MSFELRVNSPAGFLCALRLDVGADLADLQSAIEASTSIRKTSQRLFYGIQELVRSTDLADMRPALDGQSHIDLTLVRRSPEQAFWLQQLEGQTGWKAGRWLRDGPPAAREDKAVALKVVSEDGLTLRLLSRDLQADRDVVLAAVRQNAMALQHVSPELEADLEVVLAAVQQNAVFAFRLASREVRANLEVVLAAVGQNGLALRDVPAEWQANREVVLAAVTKNGSALRHASPELREESEIVRVASGHHFGNFVAAH